MVYNYADLNFINRDLAGVLPGWTAVKVLGRGAFGAVYEVHRNDSSNLEKAALKILRVPENDMEIMQLKSQGMSDEKVEAYYEKYVDEIQNEIYIMQKLVGNSHLVSYEDYSIRKRKDEIGWDIYIRMELLSGLSDSMKNHLLTEEMILKLGMDISQGLIDCHKKGILHRDIKPQNIFVNEAGDYKLGDFGVARFKPGVNDVLSFKGTVAYMAPEVYRMVETDARSDIYSLGMVLYQCLNDNRFPFVPEQFTPDDIETGRKRRFNGEPVPDPAYGSDSLKSVVKKALAPKPEDRFQSAEELYYALEAVSRERLEQAGDKRHRSLLPFLAVPLAAAVIAAVVIFGGRLGNSSKERPSTEESAEPITVTEEVAATEALEEPSEEPVEDPSGGITVPAEEEQPDEDPAEPAEKESSGGIIAGAPGEKEQQEAPDESGDDDGGEQDFADAPILWRDDVVEAKIRKLTGIDSGDIMVSDVKDITELDLMADPYDLDERKVHDISNLSVMTNLEHIYLEYNLVSDLSPLGSLTKLKELWVCENNVSDISVLSDLTELRILNIGGNQIKDFSPLRGLTKIENLYLEESGLSDLSVVVDLVSEMPKLRLLSLNANEIKNISPLRSLTTLEILYLNVNKISDISALSSLTNLRSLYLQDNAIDDISPLEDLTNLKVLDLTGNWISDYSPIEDLKIEDLRK